MGIYRILWSCRVHYLRWFDRTSRQPVLPLPSPLYHTTTPTPIYLHPPPSTSIVCTNPASPPTHTVHPRYPCSHSVSPRLSPLRVSFSTASHAFYFPQTPLTNNFTAGMHAVIIPTWISSIAHIQLYASSLFSVSTHDPHDLGGYKHMIPVL